MTALILASESPRRQALFNKLAIPYTVDIPRCSEPDRQPQEKPENFACRCAWMKARDVASRHNGCTVLGADTVVVKGDILLGKPKTTGEAEKMIRMLSGEEHEVITGVAIIRPSAEDVIRHSKTRVVFRNLSPEEINWYTQTGDGLDKAGAYGIQSLGGFLVKEIHGDWFNVVGLPVPLVLDLLSQYDADIWPPKR
jgi:septum formation protein